MLVNKRFLNFLNSLFFDITFHSIWIMNWIDIFFYISFYLFIFFSFFFLIFAKTRLWVNKFLYLMTSIRCLPKCIKYAHISISYMKELHRFKQTSSFCIKYMVLKRIQKSSLSLFKRNLSHSDNLTCAVKHSPEIKHN